MKKITKNKSIQLVLLVILPFLMTSCSEKKVENDILTQISGVWRAQNDGSLITIIYADQIVRMLIGEDAMPVSLGEIDKQNNTVNLNITGKDGKMMIWTLRQIWDKEHKGFNLLITLHDGTQDNLFFVRKISSDDFNKIANAEARNKPGAVGGIAKTAAPEETKSSPNNNSAPPAQSPPTNRAPTENTANVQPTPKAEQVNPQPSNPASAESPANTQGVNQPAQTWTPSFDCAKASTGQERLICSSRELSEADVKLSQVYKNALAAAADKDALKKQQNDWRKNKRDACSDVQCMLKAYNDRIIELSQ